MLAGMGGVSYASLVAAVSNAGGFSSFLLPRLSFLSFFPFLDNSAPSLTSFPSFSFSSFSFLFLSFPRRLCLHLLFLNSFGTIGAGTLNPDQLKEEILKTQKLTSQPIGVDLLAPFTKDYERSISRFLDVCIETGVKAFITGLGFPAQAVEKCRQNNIVLGCVCGKISHVKKAVEGGCDFVIVQGTEGGGHTGNLGLMAFLPQAVDAVGNRVPVVAAGGIFDGRGVAAALALGAEGVWVGTRFLASQEANTVKGFKEKILQAETDNGTVITKGYTGKTCRVIANQFTREWEMSGRKAGNFRDQGRYAYSLGVNHLGGDENTPGVDPEREFMPWFLSFFLFLSLSFSFFLFLILSPSCALPLALSLSIYLSFTRFSH